MSSKKTLLRRAGIVGLSTAVATSMMSLSAVTATALPPAYTALTAPGIARGATNVAGGTVTLDLTNNFVTGATQSFSIGAANQCDTAANIAKAIRFHAAPAITFTGPFQAGGTTGGTATPPTVVTGVLSSDNAQCQTASVYNKVTYTMTVPSMGAATDWFKMSLTPSYTVGSTAPVGNVSVATAGTFLASGTVVNAIVAGSTFTNSAARALVLPTSTGLALGTQTITENVAGSFFAAAGASTTVTLTLSGGATFTSGVTPTVTLPTGLSATPGPTTASSTYTIVVTTGATAPVGTMTIAGLTASTPTAATVTLGAAGSTPGVTLPAVEVFQVVDYNDRTGGATRYETAAALFNSMTGPLVNGVATGPGGPNKRVVLARGDLYPDALSANYLAGKLQTGTLLTPVGTLSSAARLSILSNGIYVVYIVGGTGAVSQAVENQIEALHVLNNPANPRITTVRLGGADRYVTNQMVNEHAFTSESTVLLASGLNFPDALAFGPIAGQRGSAAMPLILTRGTTLGSNEQSQLSDFDPTNVVIGGGTGVVSAAIETQLRASYTVARLAGADRTGTAAAIANWATVGVPPGTGILAAQGFSTQTAYVATGNLFPDALAAGPVAGEKQSVILLTYSGLGAGIPSYLGTKAVGTSAGTVSTLHALGLSGAVTPATMREAANSIGALR